MNKSIARESGVLRPMLRLSLPVLCEQLLVVMVGFVDTWLAARFISGAAPLAAIGVIAYTLWLVPNSFAAIRIGSVAIVARRIGERDVHAASQCVQLALVWGLVFAALVMGILCLFGRTYVSVMQLEPDAANLAWRYLWILLPAIPAIMVETIGINCLRAAGDTFSGFVAMSCVNLVNIVVSGGLVSGYGPFPQLGWDGLAIGTVAGHALAAIIIITLLLRGHAGLESIWQSFRPDWATTKRMFRIGVPGGIDVATVLGCQLVFLAMINSLGSIPAAAHVLAIRIESLAYLPAMAFQVAATTMSGQYLGAGDRRRAVRGVLSALSVGGGQMMLAGVVFFVFAQQLMAFFTGDPTGPVVEQGIPLLRLAAIATPFLALTIILAGALRGAGDTRWPFLFTLIGFLLVRLPFAAWLAFESVDIPAIGLTVPGWDLGIVGAWYAMLGDIVARAALMVARFRHGGWQEISV